MTAVEWLEECLTEQYPNGKFVWNTRVDIEALFKQAKRVEKQQIIDAVEWDYKSNMGEVYYDATYKNNK
jgi:disulfide oxidoreductase YuzD